MRFRVNMTILIQTSTNTSASFVSVKFDFPTKRHQHKRPTSSSTKQKSLSLSTTTTTLRTPSSSYRQNSGLLSVLVTSSLPSHTEESLRYIFFLPLAPSPSPAPSLENLRYFDLSHNVEIFVRDLYLLSTTHPSTSTHATNILCVSSANLNSLHRIFRSSQTTSTQGKHLFNTPPSHIFISAIILNHLTQHLLLALHL